MFNNCITRILTRVINPKFLKQCYFHHHTPYKNNQIPFFFLPQHNRSPQNLLSLRNNRFNTRHPPENRERYHWIQKSVIGLPNNWMLVQLYILQTITGNLKPIKVMVLQTKKAWLVAWFQNNLKWDKCY